MFKHSEVFDYEVKGSRSENCILIDSNNWRANTTNAIIEFNSRGGIANTYITEVLATNIPEDSKYAHLGLAAGDNVLLTAVSTRVYGARTFSLPINYDTTKYTDIPVSCIIGKFEGNRLSLPSLSLFRSYIVLTLVKDVYKEDVLETTTKVNQNVFRVEKVGGDVKSVSKGDVVLVKDNVVTDIMLYSKQYYVTTEEMVVGKFRGDIKLDNLELLNNYVIMEDYKSDYAEGSSSIINPCYDVFSDVDQVSEVYNEDRFRVIKSSLKGVFAGDIIDIMREATNYTTLSGTRYFVINERTFINFKIKTGD